MSINALLRSGLPLAPLQPLASQRFQPGAPSWVQSALPTDQLTLQTRPSPLPSVSFLLTLQDLRENQGFLKSGDRGESVKYIQQRLQHWGHELEADGIFGQQTAEAVQSFQRLQGLRVSALVGETELALLDKAPLTGPVPDSNSLSLDDLRQNRSYLQPGASGPVVQEIQTLLRAKGYALGLDGNYGPETTRAVRQFQQDHQIEANGFVGQTTLAALEKSASRNPELQAVRQGQVILQAGDKGDAVRSVQQRLMAWGYSGVSADGDYGPKTADAIRRFQRDHKLASNGRVGTSTLNALEQTPTATATGIRPSARGTRLGQVAEQVARRRKTVGWCYAGVADAVSRALGTSLWGKSAYMAANILARTPGFQEHKNIKAADLPKLPAGAIVVWGKTGPSPHGHISVSLGNGKEASDHVDVQRTQLRGHTNFRVFMPT